MLASWPQLHARAWLQPCVKRPCWGRQEALLYGRVGSCAACATQAFGDSAKAAAANKAAAAEKARASPAAADEAQLSLRQKARALLDALQPAYWQALIVVSLLYFARFDASFITLRARTVRLRGRLLPGARTRICHEACTVAGLAGLG